MFSKNSFRNTLRVSNSLDPDQDRHPVGPDLGPICLQRLSADDTSRHRVTTEPESSSATSDVKFYKNCKYLQIKVPFSHKKGHVNINVTD